MAAAQAAVASAGSSGPGKAAAEDKLKAAKIRAQTIRRAVKNPKQRKVSPSKKPNPRGVV